MSKKQQFKTKRNHDIIIKNNKAISRQNPRLKNNIAQPDLCLEKGMCKNMKKYILIMLLIGLVIGSAIIYSIFQVQKENTQFFSESGYILQSKSEQQTQEVERYYFGTNGSYTNKYNQKIIFEDTSGEIISVDKSNFIHYTNGSISSLQKGVIMDFSKIEDDPIIYYTIQENQILRKSGESYNIKNRNEQLEFTNFIWKITDQKYLIGGNPITINFPNGETKEITGYIEIEYSDNEVVKIYNQEFTYQTVSYDLYITMPEDIKINLSNKIVSKKGQNKMSLENMIINSDDNIEIVDIEDEKYKDNTEENTTDENTTNKNQTNQNQTDENKTSENKTNENQTSQNQTNENQANQNQTNQNQTQENTTQGQNQSSQENQTNQNTQTGDNQSSNTQGENNQNNATNESSSNGNNQSQNQNTTGSNNAGSNNGGSIIVDGSTTEDENNIANGSETEIIVEETPQINAPVFRVEELEVDSISMNAKITIQDDDSTLVGDPIIKILKNSTGKTVYENEESAGTFSLDVNVASLSPDTEYTLIVQDTYRVDEAEYTKNFVYKVFRTKSAGISFEKDYFTNNILAFNIEIEKNSKVKSAEMILMNEKGEVEQTKKIDSELVNNVEFVGLNSNTTYTVGIINVLYDGQVITNGFQMNQTYKTLKEKPEISGTLFEIDKRNGEFKISVTNITDPDNGIEDYRYEIYDTRIEGENIEPVLVINASKNQQVSIPIDGNKINRGVPYSFKMVATFNDNEKLIEYESEYSDVMKMDGVEFPSVRFEEDTVTFERIEGMLIIEDNNNTIDLNNNNLITVTYTDSVGSTKTLTTSGSLKIPVSINNLRANETYKFAAYATVDLQDGNDPIEQCYIGGAIVKTKIPQNLAAVFEEDREDINNTFTVNFQLKNETDTGSTLEAQTLSGMTFSIYAGQTTEGTPLRTLKVVDTDLEPYSSILKQDYYDKQVTLTPEFFGANNKDFRDKYYTIMVSSAYDYTQYPNTLPIVNNTITVETKGYRPDLPTDPDNAVDVVEIRNRDKDQRTDLDSSTIVGYKVTAKYNNSDLYARKIIYKAYNANTDELIETKEVEVGKDGVIPTVEFELGDGTHSSIKDTDQLRRGNSYYFAYEAILDLNGDGQEIVYPYEGEDVVLKSRTVLPIKQQAKIQMYPSTSTQNSITYKYKASDVDNSLTKDQITVTIGRNVRDTKAISVDDGSVYQEVTFENLIPGDISLNIQEMINKDEVATTKEITGFYFEGKVTLNEVKYNVALDSNRVVITLLNVDDKIDRISSITLEFVGEKKTLTKEYQYPENNVIIINLNELAQFTNEKVTVNMYAYYDTGLIGFDMNSEYKLFQKAYKSGESIYYYTLNKSNNLALTPSATGNMYISNMTDSLLKVISPEDKTKQASIQLTKLSGGYAYEYDLINQKEVQKVEIESDGSNVISFDLVIPGISMKDSAGNLNIVSELDRIKFKASIIYQETVNIENSLIYIDIYKTDENGNNEQFVRTEQKTISEFDDYITLSDLEPKSYYLIKLRCRIVKASSQVEEKYLYDVDYQVAGKAYYFSTLANVGIGDIKIIYNPIKYDSKTLDLTYTLDRIFGYQKIVYTLEKQNKETNEYEIIMDNIEDTLFKKEMSRQFDCNPGSVFEFNTQYKLTIKPIAQIQDESGNVTELELGTVEYEFKLPELKEPLIGITSSRTTNDEINFKITIYDEDRIIQNDKYEIRILDEGENDITPEEYVDKEFSTDLVNNTIKLSEVDKTKEYSIEVMTTLDRKNDKINLEDVKKRYTIMPVNDSGISVGTISATNNSVQRNKIDLVFTNSYKLTQIEKIRYSIYNINGYAVNGEQEFIPTETTLNEETVYTFTIDKNLVEAGIYYIELQFLIEDEIIDNSSLEYTYLEE